MAFNPYEMRWELFQNAEMRVTKRHDENGDRVTLAIVTGKG